MSTICVDANSLGRYSPPQRISLRDIVSQHFLPSEKAPPPDLRATLRMADNQAHAAFVTTHFADNGGEAFCPRCQCTAVNTSAAWRIWKCDACTHRFSVASGTII